MGIDHAVGLFWEYMGTGLTMIWFLLSLAYLFLKEKRKPVRIMFLYVPAVVLLLFFNPLFFRFMTKYMGDEIVYRLLWLLPVTAVIAYACVKVCGSLSGSIQKGFAVLAVFLIVVSGKWVYGDQYFVKADNLYHMPDSVVHICDGIVVPGREVMAAFPVEMVQYVRQYSPVVCMPYGREVLMGVYDEFCQAMNSDIVDLERLAPMSRKRMCHYIVFPQDQEFLGSTEDYGWELFLETDGYTVYRDPEVELVIPEV